MHKSAWILVALLTAYSSAWAEPDPLQQAQALIADKKFQGALPLLQDLVKRDPRNGRVWLALGDAERGLGRNQAAADAYLHAYAIAPAADQAATSLFLLSAEEHLPDEAYRWFQVLEKGHVGDLSGLAEHPETRALKGDARFAGLFPDKLSFEPPFVEPVKIIHEWRGEEAGDEFGWIARGIGDVDGDGITDAAISATGNPPYGNGRGKVYVYSGKSGKLLWMVEGAPGALLGTSLEAAGDVNGDGIPDVVAGAPGEDAVYVFSGKDGKQLLRVAGDPKDHDLGTSVAGIGDFNHDGVADIVAGAPSSELGGKATGRAYVYSGKDGRVLLTLEGEKAGDNFGTTVGGGGGRFFIVGAASAGMEHHGRVYAYDRLDHTPAFVKDADVTGSALGYMFVSVVGDVDKDGTPDIYASDFTNNARGHSTGRIYVYSGKDGHVLRVLTGDVAGEGFGIGPARVGDMNHDGYDDLIVGSWQYAGAAWSGGRVRVFSGKDGRVLRTITGKVPGETLGFDAVGVGDVDGDGVIDYLITSAWSGVNGLRSGRVYIVSGRQPSPSF